MLMVLIDLFSFHFYKGVNMSMFPCARGMLKCRNEKNASFLMVEFSAHCTLLIQVT